MLVEICSWQVLVCVFVAFSVVIGCERKMAFRLESFFALFSLEKF